MVWFDMETREEAECVVRAYTLDELIRFLLVTGNYPILDGLVREELIRRLDARPPFDGTIDRYWHSVGTSQ